MGQDCCVQLSSTASSRVLSFATRTLTQENLLIQCSKCRILVHMDCVVLRRAGGPVVLPFRHNDPTAPPQCKLCPVAGGALVPTHTNCAHACASGFPKCTWPRQTRGQRSTGVDREADSGGVADRQGSTPPLYMRGVQC